METVWFGCITRENRTETALGQWLNRKEPGFEPTWQFLSAQKYYVGGGFSCGTAGKKPEIFWSTPILDLGLKNAYHSTFFHVLSGSNSFIL